MRASVYLILRPTHRYDGQVISIAVDRILRTRPSRLPQSDVGVQLNLDVDERLFQQFLLEVTVAITGARQIIFPSIDVQDQSESDDDDGEEEEATSGD